MSYERGAPDEIRFEVVDDVVVVGIDRTTSIGTLTSGARHGGVAVGAAWIAIVTSDGSVGYVPRDAVRIVGSAPPHAAGPADDAARAEPPARRRRTWLRPVGTAAVVLGVGIAGFVAAGGLDRGAADPPPAAGATAGSTASVAPTTSASTTGPATTTTEAPPPTTITTTEAPSPFASIDGRYVGAFEQGSLAGPFELDVTPVANALVAVVRDGRLVELSGGWELDDVPSVFDEQGVRCTSDVEGPYQLLGVPIDVGSGSGSGLAKYDRRVLGSAAHPDRSDVADTDCPEPFSVQYTLVADVVVGDGSMAIVFAPDDAAARGGRATLRREDASG